MAATALALVGLASPALAAPATWYVDSSSGDDANACTTAASACATIGAALGKSADGDTIRIAAGNYPENLTVDTSVTLAGSADGTKLVAATPAPTVLIGATAGVDVTVSNLTINDNPSSSGMAVAGGSTVTVADSTLSGNEGPGLSVDAGSTVTVTGSELSGNAIGAAVQGSSTLTVSAGSKVDDNSTAGITADGGSTVTVDHTEVSGNQQLGIVLGFNETGPEPSSPPSTVHVVSSIISGTGGGESDSFGAGVMLVYGNGDITDSTLSDNDVGVLDIGGRLSITGGTIAENRSMGVAILNLAAAADVAVDITGTRITGNSAGDESAPCMGSVCAGAGVLSLGGSVTATGVTIDNNSVGAIVAGGTLSITDSTVRDNVAPTETEDPYVGAGILGLGFSLGEQEAPATLVELTGSTLSGNTFGLLLLGATGVVSRSTVADNTTLGVASGFPGEPETVASGAAELASLVRPAARIAGLTDAAEQKLADLPAAALPIPPGAAVIAATTIAGNGTDPIGIEGTPVGQIALGPGASVLLGGSIVGSPEGVQACNDDAVGDGPGILDAGYNVVSDDTCNLDPDSTSLADTDAQLGPLADNGGPTLTMLPASGSPAVNLIPAGTVLGLPGVSGPSGPVGVKLAAAVAAAAAADAADVDPLALCADGVTDQRGVTRPQGDKCDAGAVERNVITVTASDATMVSGGALPPITPSYAGFYGGDTAADIDTPPTCTADATSKATACSGAADAFYDFVYVPGVLTVTAPVTTTATPTTGSTTVAPTSTSASSSTTASTSSSTLAPSTSTSPSPSTVTSSSPTTSTPTTQTVAPTSTSGDLANTGFEARPGLLVGGAGVLLGFGLLLLGRRRRDGGAHVG